MFKLDPVPNSIASFTNGFPYCIRVFRFFLFFSSCKYCESFSIRLVFFYAIFQFVFALHCFFHYVSCNIFSSFCSVCRVWCTKHTCTHTRVNQCMCMCLCTHACAHLRAHNSFFSIDVYSKMSERDAFMEMVFVRWHLKIFTFTQTT